MAATLEQEITTLQHWLLNGRHTTLDPLVHSAAVHPSLAKDPPSTVPGGAEATAERVEVAFWALDDTDDMAIALVANPSNKFLSFNTNWPAHLGLFGANGANSGGLEATTTILFESGGGADGSFVWDFDSTGSGQVAGTLPPLSTAVLALSQAEGECETSPS